jgi:hypothetical protein
VQSHAAPSFTSKNQNYNHLKSKLMNTKFKLLITLATGMYFFTSCNDSATTTDKENIDTTAMSSMPNDTMNKKMDMDTINNSDNS